ncbi:hypothetical protein H364_05443 [Pasteurella multocida 671/90]|nr:hypothetical protein PMCN06_0720 [Pasteurella multocida subsp. multocida str. HN06]AHE64127.1 hypothetical protein PMCN03_0665 [Pasteurella multocida subsp. multocida str. HB03]EJS84997.1 hypothetical protein KCU_03516 [Pasteurella multocida subsp. multocida str. P52VAC]EPC10652.1 hypothetical protein I138_03895 [Pasteurella multocida 1500E]EPE65815.1 hypothetical protein I139_04929 [Pasteurella multocida 2000]EPE67375.1 hypothetical protein I140_06255 [Pasteurella multocida 93002]EPE72336
MNIKKLTHNLNILMNIWAVLYTLLGQSYNDLNGKNEKIQHGLDIKRQLIGAPHRCSF